MPVIFLADTASLQQPLPHTDKTGKVCIAPEGGVLLDVAAPRAIVQQAIAKARQIIADGLSPAGADELTREFLAYWDPVSDTFRWISSPPDEAGPIALLHYSDGSEKLFDHLVARTAEEGRTWALRAGVTVKSVDRAYFIPLDRPIRPPKFGDRWSVTEFFGFLAAAGADTRGAEEWLTTVSPPADIFFSMPAPSGKIVLGVRLIAAKGPRSSARPSAAAHFAANPTALAARLTIKRLDPGFLLPRGGGDTTLYTKKAVLVGCGAVGSQLAKLLALLGVGTLHIIDKEDLGAENIQRHLLGHWLVGKSKAVGTAQLLRRSHPHCDFIAHQTDALALLNDDPGIFTSADIVIMATGDEALERRMNAVLAGGPPRVHTWVEPLGLGGHALAVGVSARGCLECLYQRAPDGSLSNVAALVAPGQRLRRSFSGCAGDFLPFGALDAVRTATEASDLIGRVLTGKVTQATLVSWFGETSTALAEGVRLADGEPRGAPGETKRHHDISRVGCAVCSE